MARYADTEIVRRFNRSYTQRIGALEESLLGLGLPLAAARLLFEIAMYKRAGYRAIERYNDNPYARHWFERTSRLPPTERDLGSATARRRSAR